MNYTIKNYIGSVLELAGIIGLALSIKHEFGVGAMFSGVAYCYGSEVKSDALEERISKNLSDKLGED
tara:strand:+ start:198 stop:398 length:201 start_codon:yes stop_codon:yes gene_type:complete